MATLPTAYASLRFGRKTIDFYAVTGEVVGSDPRARAEERRIQDLDGARHTLRLMEKSYRLEPGDSASVLRLQPGPERRSRPVAVASPSAQSWSRTHPGVAALLSRAGVSRNVNWWLTMALFTLAALAMVWPYLHAFLVELAPGRIAALPAPDLFALAAASVPGLDTFRWSDAAAGLAPLLDSAAPGLADQTGMIVFAAIVSAFAVLVYAARSWRLVWAPVFVALAVAGAIGLNGPAGAEGPALAALGVAALLFVVGGMINRLRDEARLDQRIALLADHLVSQAPVEHVRASRLPEAAAAGIGASTITASALREPAAPHEAAETAIDAGTDVQTDAPAAEATSAAVTVEAEPASDAEAQTETAAAETLPEAATTGAAETSVSTPADTADATAEAPAEATEPVNSAPVSHNATAETASDAIEADGFVDPDLSVDTAPAIPVASPAPAAAEAAPADADSIEEARLRDDPRYAARAIVLPAPPPMPAPQTGAAPAFAAPAGDNAALQSGEAEAEGAGDAERTPETAR